VKFTHIRHPAWLRTPPAEIFVHIGKSFFNFFFIFIFFGSRGRVSLLPKGADKNISISIISSSQESIPLFLGADMIDRFPPVFVPVLEIIENLSSCFPGEFDSFLG
jgi:hypothetical protein